MGYNLTVPQVRKRLFEKAKELGDDELTYLASELFQKQMKKKAAPKSNELTPELAEEIREYLEAHPGEHNQDVANQFNVNIGRVTDALQNKV